MLFPKCVARWGKILDNISKKPSSIYKIKHLHLAFTKPSTWAYPAQFSEDQQETKNAFSSRIVAI